MCDQKRKILKTVFLLFAVISLLISCAKNDIDGALFVDETIAPYFERFAREGELRGIAVDLAAANIEGRLKGFQDAIVLGECRQEPNEPGQIIIGSEYWADADDLEKEFIVFHELGHCYLQREHFDASDTQGNCASIMHSGMSGCKNNYNEATREELLNELFE